MDTLLQYNTPDDVEAPPFARAFFNVSAKIVIWNEYSHP